MYDYCIVGGGIVGKYVAHLLKDKNAVWVSGHNSHWSGRGDYQLSNYLGSSDTWQEKATGLISFPSDQDIATFPFSREQYAYYEEALRDELGIKCLQSIAEEESYKPLIQNLQFYFPEGSLQYFWSGHVRMQGPSFDTREPYDLYWQSQKPRWDFLAGAPDFLQADFFNVNHNYAVELVGRDQFGKQKSIRAKHFILACNTPGTMALVMQTYAKHHMFTEHIQSVGQYFSDHLQLSFGFLVPEVVIPRTSIASVCFQDYAIDTFRFRLEFHSAPPRENLIQSCLVRLPHYSQADFFHHFLRIVAVAEFPPMAQSQLSLQSGGRYTVSKQFTTTMHHLRTKLMFYVKNQVFAQLPWPLLNRHQPLYYGGHLMGGMSYPHVLDQRLVMHDWSNVSVAGSAALLTGGLFNPVFTSLVFAKHLVASLPSY